MSTVDTTIDVKITLDENNIPQFSYSQNGEISDGSVVVDCGQDIIYQLVESPGYAFTGAGFLTPFNKVIDSVSVSDNGQQLILVDEDSVSGVTSFQLILSCATSGLLLLSPDPQVVNKGTEPA